MGCWKFLKSWDLKTFFGDFQWFSSVLSEKSGGGLWLYLLGDFHYLFAYDYTCDYQFWGVQLKESPRCTANAQWNAPRNAVIYNVSCLQTKTSQGSCHWGLLHIITAYYHNLPELFWWFSPQCCPVESLPVGSRVPGDFELFASPLNAAVPNGRFSSKWPHVEWRFGSIGPLGDCGWRSRIIGPEIGPEIEPV